ncbi:MAG: DNA polymerase [Candidatus Poseidoniales archaeon]
MKQLIVDIETNSTHSLIWLAVTQDVDTGVVECHTEASTLEPLVKEYDQIIGHNIIGFDAPVLRKVWNIGIPKSKAVDTLILSRLLNPQLEGGHSLKAWGNRLKNQKIEFNFEDFDNGLTEEMRQYCIQDVRLTRDLYLQLMAEIKDWKEQGEQSIRLEHDIAVICRHQETNGFKLDIEEAICLRNELADQMDNLETNLQSVFQPIVEERWSEKTGKQLKDKVTVFNVGSRKQIADRLMSLGWKPKKHTEKGQPIVDETTLEGIEIPEAQMIAEYLMMQKRVGLIDSWLKFVKEDGRVHGAVITNGAVTGRMTHHSPNMGQIPSVNKPYGDRCRQLWTVNDNCKLVGTDLSGIELRCLAHYMQDDEWTEELLNGDIHQKNADAAGITRPQAKTLIYATLYGAGPSKIGSIVGGGAKEGQEVLSRFYANTPALSRLMEKVKKVASKGYVPGLDGRRIIVRSEHAALNSLLQGCGAIIAKQWCIEAHKTFKQQRIPVLQVAFVHDEIQIEAEDKHSEQVASIMVDSAKQAGITLGFRCPVDAESKIGKNWFDTH